MTNEDPIIDWQLAIRLAGNKQTLAEEMLNLFLKNLPEEWDGIRSAKENNNFIELKRRLHKLYGAVCYCGLPRLKKSLSAFEKAVKHDDQETQADLFTHLEHEVNQVLALSSDFNS